MIRKCDCDGLVDRLLVPGLSLSDHAREVINCLLLGFVLLPQACLWPACQLLALWDPWSPFDVSAVTAVSMAGWLRAWACKASKSSTQRAWFQMPETNCWSVSSSNCMSCKPGRSSNSGPGRSCVSAFRVLVWAGYVLGKLWWKWMVWLWKLFAIMAKWGSTKCDLAYWS